MRLRNVLGSALILAGAAVAIAAPEPASDDAKSAEDNTKIQIKKYAATGSDVFTTMPDGYELVWSDEFSKDGLPDPKKWKYDVYRNAKGWYNQEKQYYSNARLKNSRVENGRLIIEAHKEDLSGEGFSDWGKQKYSSARMITKGVGDWTYGFFEIRAKLPCAVGTWPAIWTLSSDPDAKWPDGGEIDIMEHVGYEPGVIHHSIHTKKFNYSRGSQLNTKHEVSDACDAMHKYQLLWTETFLLFGVDDSPKFLFKKEKENNIGHWPFDRPQHLLLNLAVGGNFAGRSTIKASAFPDRMEVDYVRVFQPKSTTVAKAKEASK